MGADEQLWGEIVEIEREYIPPEGAMKWWGLYEELRLRLDRTSPDNALIVPFQTTRTATAAGKALAQFTWPYKIDLFPRGNLLYVARQSNLTKTNGRRPRGSGEAGFVDDLREAIAEEDEK